MNRLPFVVVSSVKAASIADVAGAEMLEDICDGSQTYLNVNKREARYKIRDRVRQKQSEWKGVIKDTRSMGKVYTRYSVWL